MKILTKVVVLGAGPAGLAAALELAANGKEAVLIERQGVVGGNTGSFSIGGVNVDYGSHRLHPASDPDVMRRVKSLLGDDLLTRPRHGRIRLMGRWIHFPLRPVDLLLRMHPRFSIGVAMDLVSKVIPSGRDGRAETFGTVLKAGLGSTICREFYFPYAKKIWGLEPDELAAAQAHKRVSAGSIGKMIKRLMPWSAGSGGANTKGIFYYPRHGYGQICDVYAKAARDAGVEILLNTDITGIELTAGKSVVTVVSDGVERTLECEQVFSTIPVTSLVRLISPAPPVDITAAVDALEFRSMVLVYLELEQSQFTEFDAHYFPGADIPFTRISEPKNYSDRDDPKDTTVLCAEVPCFRDDGVWSMSETEFGNVIKDGLASVGLPVTAEVRSVTLRRLPFAYPLYREGYEASFDPVDDWVNNLCGVLSFGRQGLYAHDNTHHAIYMALKAVESLNDDGSVNEQTWENAREEFSKHVVED